MLRALILSVLRVTLYALLRSLSSSFIHDVPIVTSALLIACYRRLIVIFIPYLPEPRGHINPSWKCWLYEARKIIVSKVLYGLCSLFSLLSCQLTQAASRGWKCHASLTLKVKPRNAMILCIENWPLWQHQIICNYGRHCYAINTILSTWFC